MNTGGNGYEEEGAFERNLKDPKLDRGFGDQVIIE